MGERTGISMESSVSVRAVGGGSINSGTDSMGINRPIGIRLGSCGGCGRTGGGRRFILRLELPILCLCFYR